MTHHHHQPSQTSLPPSLSCVVYTPAPLYPSVHESMPANFFTNMGACSTLRMFAPEILPPEVERVIVMDTGDVVLMADVAELCTTRPCPAS